jgi:hypothetical protein
MLRRGAFWFVVAVVMAAPAWSQDGPKMPSDDELKAWSAKFKPGQYQVEDYKLEATGAVIANTSKTSENCIDAAAIENISRAPAFAAITSSCGPMKILLTGDNFEIWAACPPEGEHDKVAGQFAISLGPNEGEIKSKTIRVAILADEKADPLLVEGFGTTLTRTGDCAAKK